MTDVKPPWRVNLLRWLFLVVGVFSLCGAVGAISSQTAEPVHRVINAISGLGVFLAFVLSLVGLAVLERDRR